MTDEPQGTVNSNGDKSATEIGAVENTVEPLSKDLIARSVRKWGKRFFTDSDGDIMITWKASTVLEDFTLYIQDGQSDFLGFNGSFDLDIPKEKLSEALYLCNEYNMRFLLPKVFVLFPPEGEAARFACQEAFDLEKGIHLDGLLNFLESFCGSVWNFEKWITAEMHFLSQETVGKEVDK